MMKITLSVAGVCLAASSAHAVSIVDEDFESYSSTAELGQVWNLGDGTLDTSLGNPGNSMRHPGNGGNNTNSLSFTTVYPAEGEVLTFKADIFDDGGSNNERNTAGLRDAAGANIIEMGHYNNPSHYAIRTVLFGSGSDQGFVAFPNIVDDAGAPVPAATPVAGWHRYIAEVTDTAVTFSLDLNSDGNVNSSFTRNVTQNGAFGFNIVRLGGPSGVSSPAGGVNFDNIAVDLDVIPEPTSLALLGVGGAMVLRRRRSA